MIRRHYIIKGRVQGVGFRYRAYHAAERCGVSGWVRNLYDGSVELEAEGEPADISEMLALIDRGPFIEIEDIDEKEIPVQGSKSFEYRD